MKEVRNSSAGPRVWVWDFGQNMAGAVRLTVPEGTPSGATFVIKHAEVLMHPPYGPVDGSVYTGNLRSALATDTYVHDGVTESHEFGEATYHGFRFAQLAVSGVPESWAGPNDKTLVAVHFRTDVAREGSFSAGDATGLLDKIHHAAAWVQAANLMSLPSDCPQRDERKGWMGDSALSTESFFYNFDMPALFGQWVQAMRDQQVNPFQPEHGASVGDTTPLTFGSAPGDPSWQTAYPTAVSQLWHYAEDRQLLGSILGPLHQYAAALSSAANATGLKKMFAHYGEWVTPPAVLPTSPNDSTQGPKPPKSLVSAFNFISDLDRMVELSAAAGDAAAARQYVAEAAARREEFDQAFWDWTINAYGAGFANRDGLQVSNILAAALGVKHAEEAFLSTVYDIEVTHAGKLAVGISGSKNLFRQLTLHGYSSLAVDLMLQREYPSFGFMIDGGTHGYEPATTLWELWTAPVSGPGMNSRAHHMFSAGPEMWFFEHVAGLGLQCGGQTGFACLRIHPRVTAQPQIPWANATVPTLRGPATVSWTNGTSVAAARLAGGEAANRASQGLRADNGQLLLSVRLPVGGASAEVVVPAGDTGPGLLITANGELAWAEGEFVSGCQGVAGASAVDGGVEFLVGPGGAFVFSATFA
ncbi:hypothetical protein FNF29_08439 [Cafeteria roenbergensis]|nr:hypothetical protein FNF29_08439 [Cafeteria roenbergensis]|eukprot:KAA0145667.1 hypothetical protein FNF29_08439 [Cafeteria roenbergensis]